MTSYLQKRNELQSGDIRHKVFFLPKNINHLIFDLDGVLCNTVDLHVKALKQALDEHNIHVSSSLNILNPRHSIPTKEKLKWLSENGYEDLPIENIIERKNILTENLINQRDFYSKKTYDMFRWLKSHGFTISLATNTHKQNAVFILGKMDIIHFFDTIVSAYDIEEAKPSSLIIYKIFDDLNIIDNNERYSSLYIDDTTTGLQAGVDSAAQTYYYRTIASEEDHLDIVKIKSMLIEITGGFQKRGMNK